MDSEAAQDQITRALYECDPDTLIMLLRDHDVDVDFRDVTNDLQTMLMKLCYVNIDITSLKTILEHVFEKYPDVNIQDSWGRTVLMHACIANKPVVIEGLLDFDDTDVSLTDFDGNSAMAFAVQNCDIYTLEDILQHPCGPRLLTVHNSKGQTPVTIAEKAGDKSIVKLFKSYIDKTVGLQQKKKSRNQRQRDVIKLKPAQRKGRERQSVGSAPVEKTTTESSSGNGKENKLLSRPTLDVTRTINPADIQEKCGSAPVTRTNPNTFDKPYAVSSLQLSSPRLQRRHHKQNSLLEECFKRNNVNILPPMNLSQNFDDRGDKENGLLLPEHSIRRQRRPSISLPDLRSVAGFMVNSGSNTPGSDCHDDDDDNDGCHSNNVPRAFKTINDETTDDDVFSQTFPKRQNKLHKTSSKQSLSEISLPDIHKSLSKPDTSSSSYSSRKGYKPLNRPRKFSNSDDHLHRTLVVNDNG